MLDSNTKRKIDNARDILVGILPVPKSQIDLITLTLIYKFMYDMDQLSIECGGVASYFVGDYEKYSWEKIMDQSLSGHKRVNLFDEGLIKMNQNANLPELFRDIFRNAYLPFRNSETLNMFLEEMNGFDYSHSENLGNAFEYLLSKMSTQGDAGQFRTPRHIIEFIVQLVNPGKDDKILDPACGTAGFLITAYKHIMQKHEKSSKFNHDKLVNNIVGYDISPDMVRLSLVNMYLHKFPNPNIFAYDTLTQEEKWNDNFSCILANPPFMSPKGGIKPHDKFAIKSKRSEVLFVDYMMEHLTQDGKAGIIVPEGIIFQSQKAHKSLRKKMIEQNYLYAVVSLPSGIFQPYSGVKTSILLFDKIKAKASDKIIFIKVDNDGFSLSTQRQPISKNDLPHIIESLKLDFNNLSEEEIEGLKNITVVEKAKLAENDYNLSGDRYFVEEIRETSIWNFVELGEIANYINGYAFRPKDWTEEGIPIIRIQNLTGSSDKVNKTQKLGIPSKYLIEKGDLLISWSATIGFFIWDKENAYLNQHIFKVATEESILKMYLYFLGDRITKEIKNKVHGNTMTHITKGTFNSIKIPLPPLKIQEEIVAEIEVYQKIIDGAKQVVKNYKPHIDIEPEWEVVELGKVCDVRDGTHDSPKYLAEGIPLITSKNLKDDKIDFTNVKFISEEDHAKISRRSKVVDGDVLFAMIGTIGNPTIVKTDKIFSIKNVALFRFKNNTTLNNHFLKVILESQYAENNLIIKSRGGTQKFVSLTDKGYRYLDKYKQLQGFISEFGL